MPRSILCRTILYTTGLALALHAQRPIEPPRLIDAIRFLSAHRLQGARPGAAAPVSAAASLARRFSQVGVEAMACAWVQHSVVGRDAPAARQAETGAGIGRNVIGLRPGRALAQRRQRIL